MWLYKITTGALSRNGVVEGSGYSGRWAGKNNPAMQAVRGIGPIPAGVYHIGEPFDSTVTGRFCLPLTPRNRIQCFGRDGFQIHGDSAARPGEASRGCIVLPWTVRKRIYLSEDKVLEVVE